MAAPVLLDGAPRPIPHVRSVDRWVLQLVANGCRRSSAFQRLVEEIEQSDVLVYIEATHELPRNVDAYLQLAGASDTLRFVRVVVKIPASTDTLIAQLGHELQHATEVARARDVRDQGALEMLYRRIGDDSGAGWDTAAARQMGELVARELRQDIRLVNADATPAAAVKTPKK